MMSKPNLIDSYALKMHRNRISLKRGLFLHDLAIDDVKDRLSMVNKSFKNVAIVTGIISPWLHEFPDSTIVPDTDLLELEETNYDLVIHGMSLHWANDPVGQLIQCRRALRPDGLLLAVFLGGQTLQELRSALGQAEIEILGGLSPRILPMGDIRDTAALLQRAGLAMPVADSATIKTSYDDIYSLMRDLRYMGETNAMYERRKAFTPKNVFSRAAELYCNAFSDEKGRIVASFEQIILTGWAPDECQPKPLRPGSATTRLADILGTKETPIKD